MMEKIDTKGLPLDLACGDNKREGHFGIDFVETSSTDAVFDLLQFPWPIESGSVPSIVCSHFFEHIPGLLRPEFMDECYRVLKPRGTMEFITPYHTSMRATQDFTHAWPPISEASYLYFNREWRKSNKLEHGYYDMECDFDYGYGYLMDPDIQVRGMDYQMMAVKHWNNSIYDLQVNLVSRKTESGLPPEIEAKMLEK